MMTDFRQEIEEQMDFLAKIMEFVYFITRERGRIVSCKQKGSYKHIVRELVFDGFRFIADTEQAVMGDYDMRIHWEDQELLHISYQVFPFDPYECEVLSFADTSIHPDGWMNVLERMAKDPDLIFARIDAEEEAEQERLRGEAKRLRVRLHP
jgi:hypothetical protein